MAENLKVPKISVIMPVYNGEKYLKEAINSILDQTCSDFELLLIDDASSDKTGDIINSYDDNRIIYIKNEQNLGLIKTLNKGLGLARGEFIARMDQDDISHPERFEKQLALLAGNPEIGVCGTWFTFFGDAVKERTIQHPENNENIKIHLLGYCTLGHPTIMLRKEVVLNLRYDEDYQSAEDYEFWTRLAKVTKFYNIQESLLQYRLHKTNISVLENSTQAQNSKKIIGNQLRYIGLEDNDANIRFCKILFGSFYMNRFTDAELRKLIIFANNLESENKHKKIYDAVELKSTVIQRLLKIFNKTEEKKLSLILFLLKNRRDMFAIERGLLANTKMMAKIILKK